MDPPRPSRVWVSLGVGLCHKRKPYSLLLHISPAWLQAPGCGILPLSSESSPILLPHLQPSQDLPVPLAFLFPMSLECYSPWFYVGMSAGSWVSCSSKQFSSLPQAPKS